MQPKKEGNHDATEEELQIATNGKNETPLQRGSFLQRKWKVILMTIAGIFVAYNLLFTGNEPKNKNKTSKDQNSTEVQIGEVDNNNILTNRTNGKIAKEPQIKSLDYGINDKQPRPQIPDLKTPDIPEVPTFVFEETNKTNPLAMEKEKSPLFVDDSSNKKEQKTGEETTNEEKDNQLTVERRQMTLEERRTQSMFAMTGQGGVQSSDGQKSTRNTGVQSGNKKDIIIINGSGYNFVKKKPENEPNVERLTSMDTTIGKGKMIDVVLETAINSELPGTVRGVISQNVYGEAGTKIILPMGSRVFGSYSTKIARGASRLDIMWNEILRPDGIKVSVDMNATDQFGRAGIEGDVDNRYRDIFANSLLMNLIPIGTTLATLKLSDSNLNQTQVVSPTTGSVMTSNINPVTTAATTVVKNTSDIINKMIPDPSTIAPVISLPHGTRLKVFVNRDINLPAFKKTAVVF